MLLGLGLALALLIAFLLGGCGGKEFTSDASDLFDASTSTDAAAVPPPAGSGGALPESGAGGAGGHSASEAGASSAGSAAAGAVGIGGARSAAPCSRTQWRASAFAVHELDPAGGTPGAALDGDPATRWASGLDQAAGQWFAVDLPAGVVLAELELEAVPSDLPTAIAVELDGIPVPATMATRAPGVLGLVLGQASPASTVRLVITSPAPAVWWSIRELRAVCK